MWLHYSGYHISNQPIGKLTRLQIDAIGKMQELIVLAKSGKNNGPRLSHKEFINRIKCKMPKSFKYDTCSDEAKQKWLSIVEKNKNNH